MGWSRRSAILDVQIGELSAQFFKLRKVDGPDVGVKRITGRVVLMVFLRLIKTLQGNNLSNDASPERILVA